MPMQGSLNIERMCQMAWVSRAGFYRSLKERVPREEGMKERSAIEQIALEHRRRYGYRRVTAELRHKGMLVNHKRVARTMREDSLLAVQPKQFATTTGSNHGLEIYLNLARRLKLSGMDQLWIADITYIRLKEKFAYVAVILDGFSRKVVGWKLDRTLTSRLATEALEMAIEARRPMAGLVHLSDRGIQCAAAEYLSILKKHELICSMSRPANPYDNASCESFIKTLKREEIYANEYETLEHLRDHIEEFIERYYNQKRLNSALGYRPPEEFEQQAARESDRATSGSTVTFFPESSDEVSTGLLGEGTQEPSLPQTPSRIGESTG
jgi:putative transposase